MSDVLIEMVWLLFKHGVEINNALNLYRLIANSLDTTKSMPRMI